MRLPRIRYGLRTYLVLSGLAACGLGFLASQWYRDYQHDAALRRVQDAGGRILPDEEDGARGVRFSGEDFGDQQLSEVAPTLLMLPELRQLLLVRVSVSDESVDTLSRFTHLEEIYFFETKVSDDGQARLKELLPKTRIRTEPPDRPASGLVARDIYRHAMIALGWSPHEPRLATGSGDGVVRLWSLESTEPVREWQAHANWAFSLVFSPDGRTLATGGGDNLVRLWDAATGESLGELVGHTNDIHSLAYTPNGAKLVSAGDDMMIRVWDLAGRQTERILTGHHGTIPAIALSPDGSLLASASRDGTVRMWRLADGDCLAVLAGHTDDVMSVAFSPDGRQLASGSYDGTVRLWDATTHELLSTLTGQEGQVFHVAFAPEGTQLATACEHGVRLWELATGQSEVAASQNDVAKVDYQPGGKFVATTNADGELRLLNPRTAATLAIYRTRYGEQDFSEPLLIAVGDMQE